MPKFYVSLVRGLLGYYVVFEAPSRDVVVGHVAEYFGRMWCSVYDETYFNSRIKGVYPVQLVNEDKPIVLETWQWE